MCLPGSLGTFVTTLYRHTTLGGFGLMNKQVKFLMLFACSLILVGAHSLMAADDDEDTKGGIVLTTNSKSDDYDKAAGGAAVNRNENASQAESQIKLVFVSEPEPSSSQGESGSAPKKTSKHARNPKNPNRMSFSDMSLNFHKTK